MRNRNTRIIMGILVGLVLFTSSVALLLYLKQSKANENITHNVEVYVAAKNLKEGDYIGASSIVKAKVPQNYISFTPLMAEEIIGRYAKVDIFAKEPIRPEKLATTNPLENKIEKHTLVQSSDVNVSKESIVSTNDTISIPLNIFKNKDTSLKAGSFVDIVSVMPKQQKGREYSFTTKYIALHVPVHSFVSNNITMKTYTHTVTETKNKVTTSKIIEADTIVLDMSPKDIKNFLALYYKTQLLNNNRAYNTNNYGGQLWLVNAATDADAALQKEKEKMLLDHKKHVVKKRRKKKHVQKVSIAYEK